MCFIIVYIIFLIRHVYIPYSNCNRSRKAYREDTRNNTFPRISQNGAGFFHGMRDSSRALLLGEPEFTELCFGVLAPLHIRMCLRNLLV